MRSYIKASQFASKKDSDKSFATRRVMNDLATSITHHDKTESDRFGLVHWSFINLILTVSYNDMAALVIQS